MAGADWLTTLAVPCDGGSMILMVGGAFAVVSLPSTCTVIEPPGFTTPESWLAVGGKPGSVNTSSTAFWESQVGRSGTACGVRTFGTGFRQGPKDSALVSICMLGSTDVCLKTTVSPGATR